MAQKTMIRQLISKWGLMSIEMQTAYAGDMGVIRDDGVVDYIDNPENEIFKDITPVEETEEAEPMSIPNSADDTPLPFEAEDQQDVEQLFFG